MEEKKELDLESTSGQVEVGEDNKRQVSRIAKSKIEQIKEFISSLKQQIEEKDKKIKEYEELIKRIAADFDNYKKKVNKEKVEYIRFANKDLVLDLLPVIDNFDRAIAAIENSNLDEGAKDLFVGIKLIHKELINVLLKYGVVSVDVEGKIFDPNISEVVEVEEVEGDEEKEVVTKEYLKAYKMYDQVIRSGKVKVQKIRKRKDVDKVESVEEDKSSGSEGTGGGGVSSSSS